MLTTSQSYLGRKLHRLRQDRKGGLTREVALAYWRYHAIHAPPAPPFATALRAGDTVALIAEFKRRSPSSGQLITDVAPDCMTRFFADHGSRAVSVLTDGNDFGGSLHDLRLAAKSGAAPCLRKDFIADATEVYQARVAGAAAALLIVAALEQSELTELLRVGEDIALECLVEVHDESDVERALDAGARLIGINNRDLHSLATDLRTTELLAPLLPTDTTIVSESGIRTPDDVARVRDTGAHAVLVGEAILRQPTAWRGQFVRSLAGVSR